MQLAYLDESKAPSAYYVTALVVADEDTIAPGECPSMGSSSGRRTLAAGSTTTPSSTRSISPQAG